MSEPTTVRGWLETLPEPLRTRAIESSTCLDQFPRPVWQTLPQVLYAMYLHGNSDLWLGVRHYVCGIGEDQSFDGECRIGYNVAKAAYESAQNAAYIGVSELGSMFWNGKEAQRTPIFVAKCQENPLTNGNDEQKCTECEKMQPPFFFDKGSDICCECSESPQVGYIAIDPKELAELRAKAAAWDTFSLKMRYIINAFEDLEGLKP